MSNKKCSCTDGFVAERVGKVGGQAVIEGVMMRGPKQYTTAVRTPSGRIETDTHNNTSIKDKYKFFGLPIIRGVVNFVEMLLLSMSTLTFSAEAQGLEEEETRFEKWLSKHFGKSLVAAVAVVGTVLGVALSLFLFMYLPIKVTALIEYIVGDGFTFNPYARSAIEGVIKMAIFVSYIALVSLMPDIRRTFEYHGAEHKSIFCYERGLELTVENVKNEKRFHPRCGTSFMVVMIVVGILISMLIKTDIVWLRTVIRLLVLPFIVGLGYEIIRYAGRHDNLLIRTVTKPGMWMQRLTTKEPDASQIECAIVALKSALPDIFPTDDIFTGIVQPEKVEESAENGEAPAEDGEAVAYISEETTEDTEA